jgi:HEAT repeat protein
MVVRRILHGLLATIAVISGVAAQAPGASPEEVAFIKSSLATIDLRDNAGSLRTAKDIAALGPKALPVLADILRTDHDCLNQWVASGVVAMIEPGHPLELGTLADMARGNCKPASKEQAVLMRQAAMAIGRRPEGVPVLIDLLKSREVFLRQSGAFSLHDLLEVAGAEHRPDGIEATPQLVKVTKDAVVALRRVLSDKDEIVRCVAEEALQRGSHSQNREIADESTKALEGANVKCSK